MAGRNGIGYQHAKNIERKCVMCGVRFFASRDDAKTENNRCRSALRRWMKLYGMLPVKPPGVRNLQPPYWDTRNWYLDFLGFDPTEKKTPKNLRSKRA